MEVLAGTGTETFVCLVGTVIVWLGLVGERIRLGQFIIRSGLEIEIEDIKSGVFDEIIYMRDNGNDTMVD